MSEFAKVETENTQPEFEIAVWGWHSNEWKYGGSPDFVDYYTVQACAEDKAIVLAKAMADAEYDFHHVEGELYR